MSEYKIPLGLCKQATMKLDAFISDLYEIATDLDMDPIDIQDIYEMCEMCGAMGARIINIVKKECGEEDFLNESFPMDTIDEYPEPETNDIMDDIIL